MKQLQESQDKIQKICDTIKQQTIEPAKQEAKEILENAHMKAEEIKNQAQKEAGQMTDRAKREIEKQKKLLKTSLALASKQVIDVLKQQIEEKFFAENLSGLVEKQMADPKTIARLIEAVIQALEKEGTNTNLTAYIAKDVKVEEVSRFLARDVIDKLKDKKVLSGDFLGGAKIVLRDKKITLDVSGQEIKELISGYIRKDFRELIFSLKDQ